MACSIISDTIKVILNQKKVVRGAKPRYDYHSALQNPDLSKFQLDNILRNRGDSSSPLLPNRDFWKSFGMGRAIANMNDHV